MYQGYINRPRDELDVMSQETSKVLYVNKFRNTAISMS